MAKYGYEYKLQVVQYYFESRCGYRSTSDKFQVDRSQVREWIALYNKHGADALRRRPFTTYALEFKCEVIEHMRTQNLSIKQTAAHFNIPAFKTISTWKKLYDQGKILFPNVRRVSPQLIVKPTPPPEKPLEEMTHEELLAEVRYLRTEHAYLKKLDALIQHKRLPAKKKQ